MTTPPTDQQLDDIEARANAATPGPWRKFDRDYPHVVIQGSPSASASEADGMISTNLAVNEAADAAFIAAVDPEVAKALVAEVRRQRAENADLRAELDKLIRWRREDGTSLTRMRATIERLRAEAAATWTKTLATEADLIVQHCPDHGPPDQPTVWIDCHCAVADDMRRRAASGAPVAAAHAPQAPEPQTPEQHP